MVGRKRRATSNSTVATVDQVGVRHYKETSILKPVSNNIHTDEWPTFLLADATVYRRDGTLVNQLHVDLEGPFIIRGKLELEKDHESILVNRNMKTRSIWIQIESSNAFSVGAKDDSLSVPVVWASGAAGWFEIVSSERYQPICDIMFQAVRLLYSLQDQYDAALETLQKSKKKKKATYEDVVLDLDELLFQYALRAGDGLTLPETYERLHDQAIFLLSHFPKGTGLFKYLADKFPDIAKKLANKDAKDIKRTDSSRSPLKAYDYPHREKSTSLEIADGRKKGMGYSKLSAPRTTRTSERSDVEAASSSGNSRETLTFRSTRAKQKSPEYLTLEEDGIAMVDPPDYNIYRSKLSRGRRTNANREHLTANPTSLRMVEQQSTGAANLTEGTKRTGNIIVDTLQEVRKQMLQLISEGKQKKSLDQIHAKSWRTKVYMEINIRDYHAVEEIFLYHARNIVQFLGPEWHSTQIYQWAKDNASNPPTFQRISETEIRQLVRRVKKGGRGALAEMSANESSPAETTEHVSKQAPKRGRLSGKAAGLRPSTGSKKRLRHEADFEDDIDLDEDGSLKRSKKPRYLDNEDDDDDDDDGENDNDENISSDDSDRTSSKNNKSGAENQTADDDVPVTELVIRAEKLPSARPKGPNQTWTCEESDCEYVVRAAHEEQGQKLISAHYEEHEKEAYDAVQKTSKRVSLAVQEARGHMPINHLLEKIRNLGEKSKRRGDVHVNGQAVPEPIKRTLLI
ncbi:hypothetical protein F5Y19DRAFT_286446 [Xylariaceae sp. FL1651]|nr:hypothetical protein F5Y19DRAFT_286446 [Xylariaceae sp. FL1651]